MLLNSWDDWLVLTLILFAGAASPGPSLAVVMQTALREGRHAGFWVALGHGCGILFYAGAVTLGLASMLAALPALSLLLQAAGALFLLYLAVNMLRSAWLDNPSASPEAAAQSAQVTHTEIATETRLRTAGAGFLLVFLNPKIAVFFLAVFSQFVSSNMPLPDQVSVAIIAGGIDAGWYALIAIVVTLPQANRLIQAQLNRLDGLFGLTLIACALWLLVDLVKRF